MSIAKKISLDVPLYMILLHSTAPATEWQQHQQHERLNPDSWIAEQNDYVNSAYREKRKLIF